MSELQSRYLMMLQCSLHLDLIMDTHRLRQWKQLLFHIEPGWFGLFSPLMKTSTKMKSSFKIVFTQVIFVYYKNEFDDVNHII